MKFEKKPFYTLILINNSWRKYQIGIHSEPIRTIPIHSDICIRANANHSEPIQKTFCKSFDEKRKESIRPNPIRIDPNRTFNQNQSE